MTDLHNRKVPENLVIAVEFLKVLFFVYCFLVSIDLMGIAFKASRDTVQPILEHATANPFLGLVLGIVVTSIIQSSSSTTSIVVGLVSGGVLSLQNAIPVIMGANIGTTVTNTIVSFGYVGRKNEFERAFGASIVHDMFNIYATMILFPIELLTGLIYNTSVGLENVFEKMGGFDFISPLKIIVHPVAGMISEVVDNHIIVLVIAFVILFLSLKQIVDNMKGIVMEKIENILNKYLFRNVLISLFFGIILTAIVQSSSVTTSIIIPLVGAGILTVEQIFPYTLGANIGTTITAMLAAFTVSEHKDLAVSVALAHLIFNVFGITVIYPIKKIPIWTAKTIARYVSKSKKHFLLFLVIYILLHIVPIVFAFFD
ncbi:MAG: Na/Pi symporter [Candidatus Latescibacteria bacterium]|nr:Na/Pi symporter [Candidatus Latescibacterota bacterium]